MSSNKFYSNESEDSYKEEFGLDHNAYHEQRKRRVKQKEMGRRARRQRIDSGKRSTTRSRD